MILWFEDPLKFKPISFFPKIKGPSTITSIIDKKGSDASQYALPPAENPHTDIRCTPNIFIRQFFFYSL